MTKALALNITAVNSATRVIQDFNKRVSAMTRPFQEMQRSLQQFSRAAGFGVVKEKLESLTRGAKRVAESFAKIGAPLLALVGGGTIAGLYALTEGWAKFGLQLSQTSQILGIRLGNWIGGSIYDRTHRAQNAMSYFQSQGWTRNQAAGIAANIQAESGFNPRAVGDHGAAYGIGQWHADRQKAFNAWALRNKLPGLRQADRLEQLQYYNYELRHSAAGKRLAGATSADESGRIVSLYDERPADAAGQAAARGALATRLAGPSATPALNVSVQTTVHRDNSTTTKVHTPSGLKIVHTSPVNAVA